jgi:hypothetical protein
LVLQNIKIKSPANQTLAKSVFFTELSNVSITMQFTTASSFILPHTNKYSHEILTAYLSAGFSRGNKAMKFSIKTELPFSKGTIALQTSPTDTFDVLLKVDR